MIFALLAAGALARALTALAERFMADTPEPPTHHFELDLQPAQREALLDLLEHDKRPSITMRNGIARRVRDSRRRDGDPLPPAHFDWARAEREAAARGESLAEYVWDDRPGGAK